jgi:membrane fusion protein (multidrug efflux system)
MITRMTIMLLVTGTVLGLFFGFQAFQAWGIKQYLASQSNPVQTVSAVIAHSEEWSESKESTGSVRAVNGAVLSPQVAGTVAAIHFRSGDDVKQGALLVELVSADDAARLETLKAAAALAKLTYDRDSGLLKSGSSAVSQATVDADEANLKGTNAQVAQQQALLDYKFIRAPFPGRLGIRQADLGQYMAAGTPIVPLQQLDPVQVIFYLPQQALAQVKKGQPVAAAADAYPGQDFAGEISAINSLVDTASRNVSVEATFKNPDSRLLPGMFVKVKIGSGTPQRFVTLPSTAIAYNSFGDIVYLVEHGSSTNGQEQLKARQAFVTTGARRGDQVAILKGVKDGDMVVSAGQMKLHNGSLVKISNTVQPSASAAPQVANE